MGRDFERDLREVERWSYEVPPNVFDAHPQRFSRDVPSLPSLPPITRRLVEAHLRLATLVRPGLACRSTRAAGQGAAWRAPRPEGGVAGALLIDFAAAVKRLDAQLADAVRVQVLAALAQHEAPRFEPEPAA